ncbi:MAG: DUF3631 domain-containing protein [Burkholderiales bacterium]|nr:DUF3631 domain-containing protein [Burkholderiales bacterium]
MEGWSLSNDLRSEPAPVRRRPGRRGRVTPDEILDRHLSEVHAAELLRAIEKYLGRFVAYPAPEAHLAHTLWIAHTHLMDLWESTPRIAFLSPEPGSGKTRALEITETLAPRPVEAVNATPAYLFRKVSDPDGLPTILYDEIDCLFGPKAKENEELRAMLNAGHRRGAMAGRCVLKGKTIVTEEFPAFAPVALAGLGNLPDTILSRSVVIRMRRRAPTETVEPYRRRVHSTEGNELRDRLATWADEVREIPDLSPPEMPLGIADRDADVWEALLTVAELAGRGWAERARAAAVSLVKQAKESSPSLGVRLLGDLRQIFGDRDAMATEEILKGLQGMEEGPWNDMRGSPIDSRRLANLLKPYGVGSRNVRIDSRVVRGYSREDLHDPWVRYLPSGNVADVADVAHPNEGKGESEAPFVADTKPNVVASFKRKTGEYGGSEVFGPTSRAPSSKSATSATSATSCPRCGGEGCAWCDPAAQNLGVAHA